MPDDNGVIRIVTCEWDSIWISDWSKMEGRVKGDIQWSRWKVLKLRIRIVGGNVQVKEKTSEFPREKMIGFG